MNEVQTELLKLDDKIERMRLSENGRAQIVQNEVMFTVNFIHALMRKLSATWFKNFLAYNPRKCDEIEKNMDSANISAIEYITTGAREKWDSMVQYLTAWKWAWVQEIGKNA